MIFAFPHYHPENKTTGGVIDVWLLDTSTEMSRETTHSRISAPKRHRLLDTLTVSYSINLAIQFDCLSNEFTTLEFSCQSTSQCDVDFWQDKRWYPIEGTCLKTFDGQSSLTPRNRILHYPRAIFHYEDIVIGRYQMYSMHLPRLVNSCLLAEQVVRKLFSDFWCGLLFHCSSLMRNHTLRQESWWKLLWHRAILEF